MMWNEGDGGADHARFADIVDAIFSTPDRAEAEAIVKHYSNYWMDIIGTRGFKGKNTVNANSLYNALFDSGKSEVDLEPTNVVQLNEAALDQLEQGQ